MISCCELVERDRNDNKNCILLTKLLKKIFLGINNVIIVPLHAIFITTKELCIDMCSTTNNLIKQYRNKLFDNIPSR